MINTKKETDYHNTSKSHVYLAKEDIDGESSNANEIECSRIIRINSVWLVANLIQVFSYRLEECQNDSNK